MITKEIVTHDGATHRTIDIPIGDDDFDFEDDKVITDSVLSSNHFYIVDTSNSPFAIRVTLPAVPNHGDRVGIYLLGMKFCHVMPNGSNINGHDVFMAIHHMPEQLILFQYSSEASSWLSVRCEPAVILNEGLVGVFLADYGITHSANNITLWNDLKSGYHLTAVNNPTFKISSDYFNGNPSVMLNGCNYLYGSTDLFPNTTFTIACSASVYASSSNQTIIAKYKNVSNMQKKQFKFAFSNSSNFGVSIYKDSSNSSLMRKYTSDFKNNKRSLLIGSYDGGNASGIRFWLDEQTFNLDESSSSFTPIVASVNTTVGCALDSAGQAKDFFNGEIQYILIYDNEITYQRLQALQYLYKGYGGIL